MNPEQERHLSEAIRLVATTPGYEAVGQELAQRKADDKITFDPNLPDRAQTANFTHVLVLGPEAMESDTVSLAQTLVHEHHHIHQSPLEKTTSFWTGIVKREDAMQRYEKPAYDAALRFLQAVETAHPELANSARSEYQMVAQAFEVNYQNPTA